MGQASKRGSFEERKRAAIIANQERFVEQKRLREEREQNKTPEERARSRRARTALAIMAGLSSF